MNPTIRMLYAEDNPQDADLTRSHFTEHAPEFEIEIVRTGQACLDRMAETGVDLLLLDHHLPDMKGLDVIKALAQANLQVPTVFVTGIGDEELVVKALRLGAANYVAKSGNYMEPLPGLLHTVLAEHRRKQRQGELAPVIRRILYVEHDPMDIELTAAHLAEAAPHLVLDVVRTCAEALARLAGPPAYDLVLVDLRMPDQNGLDFVRAAMGGGRMPPFIMISGEGDDATAIAALKLGAADYIAKRQGYLDQLTHTIDHAISHYNLDRLARQLRVELAERKLAEDTLRTSQQVIEGIINAIPVRVFWKDKNLVYLGCNAVFAHDAGFADPQEVVGKDDYQLAWPDLAESYRRDDRQVIASGCPKLLIEEPQTTPRGDTLTMLTNKLPLRDHEGQICGVIGTYMDITDRKRAEQAQEELQMQLRQAQKMEAVGRLAGGVAHDFNNMLGVILGFTELAITKLAADDPIRMYLDEVKTAAERSADITRQLLAFARKQIIALQVLDLNDTIANSLKMLRRLIGEDIELIWKPARDLWPVKMDPSQIDQILANLMVNARDAIAGVGKVTIETAKAELNARYCESHAGSAPGRYVLLAASDNGCGMDKETLARLFEPFFTTKEVGKGTGLGLATIYGIVNQNNGFIDVQSAPGQGTTFKIYLPCQEPLAAATGQPRQPSEAATGTETVLLVEDETPLLTFARLLLEDLGYTVLAADSPLKALRLAQEHPHAIHLLMTDVVMPKMSGRDLFLQLEASRPGLRCLYMSGFTADIIANHGEIEEGVHFVQKPFSREGLAVKLREALAGNR